MKAIIIVEQLDNRITIKWKQLPNAKGETDFETQQIVAFEGDKETAIGKMIWEDIKMMMDSDLCNIAVMEIEYTTPKTTQS